MDDISFKINKTKVSHEQWETVITYFDAAGLNHQKETNDHNLSNNEIFKLIDINKNRIIDDFDCLSQSLKKQFGDLQSVLKACGVTTLSAADFDLAFNNFNPSLGPSPYDDFSYSPYSGSGGNTESCEKTPTEDPKKTPFVEYNGQISSPWKEIDPDKILSDPVLIKNIKTAIEYIEANQLGQIDTYGVGVPWNTYHTHMMIPFSYLQSLPENQNLYLLGLELLSKDDKSLYLLYHTEETTGRFTPYSENRNLLQQSHQQPVTYQSPSCAALTPWDLRMTTLIDPYFAIVTEDSPFYNNAHELEDGRRFIVWVE